MSLARTRSAAVALLALAASTLVGCVATPSPPPPCSAVAIAPLPACDHGPALEIASVVVSQQQAVPDFDGSRYLVEDPGELARLEAILNPTHPVVTASGCDGGRTTVLEVVPADGDPFVLTTDTCSSDATAEEIDALVQEWRESGAFPLAP